MHKIYNVWEVKDGARRSFLRRFRKKFSDLDYKVINSRIKKQKDVSLVYWQNGGEVGVYKIRITGIEDKIEFVENSIIRQKETSKRYSNFREREFIRNPICGLCRLRIYTFKDSSVDHIIPVSRGGKSHKNLQLTHSICNGFKGDASPGVVSSRLIRREYLRAMNIEVFSLDYLKLLYDTFHIIYSHKVIWNLRESSSWWVSYQLLCSSQFM